MNMEKNSVRTLHSMLLHISSMIYRSSSLAWSVVERKMPNKMKLHRKKKRTFAYVKGKKKLSLQIA